MLKYESKKNVMMKIIKEHINITINNRIKKYIAFIFNSIFNSIFNLIFTLSFIFVLNADDNKVESKAENNVENNIEGQITDIRAGLFLDNGLHPGVKLGTSYILKDKNKYKKYLFKKRGERFGPTVKAIQYMIDGNLGFYNHPNNHSGSFLGTGLTRMVLNKRKMRTFGLSFETNYLRRFYNIKTYELIGNDDFTRIKGAGRNSFMLALAPSFGKYFKFNKADIHIYIKPSLQLQQYNHSLFPNTALEIGTMF